MRAGKEQPPYNIVALLALAFFFIFFVTSVSAIPITGTNASSSSLPVTRALYPTPTVYYLNITVNNSQFLDGYNLASLNSTFIQPPISEIRSNLSSYVPYIGANKNVDLNNFNLTNVQKIGVGTTSPNTTLQVASTTDDTIPALGMNGGKFSFLKRETGIDRYGLIGGQLGTGNFYMQVQRVDGTATAYNLLLQPTSGNLGINTTSPTHRLTVGSDTAASTSGSVVIKQASTADGFLTQSSTNDAYLRIYNSGSASVIDSNYQTSAGYKPLTFITSNTERVRIDTAGSVGIGTTAPGMKLDVNGSHVGGLGIARFKSTDSAFVVIDSATGDGGIRIKNNSADAWLIGTRDGYGLRFNNASDNNVVTILQNGNLGIGTTTPSRTLDVRGLGNFSGTIYINNATDISLFQTTTNTTATYVPYVGANNALNMGNFNVTTNGLVVNNSIRGTGNITAGGGSVALGLAINSGNITATGSPGAFAFGFVDGIGNTITAAGGTNKQGAVAMGTARNGQNQTIQATNRGAVAFGVTTNGNNLIESTALGSFVHGIAQGDSILRASGQGSFVQGSGGVMIASGIGSFAQGAPGASVSIFSSNLGSFAQGSGTSLSNAFNNITASGQGSFAHGYLSGDANQTIIASGDGSFVQGYLQGSGGLGGNYLIGSGNGAVVIGLPNMTCSATGTICLGKNVNISGANSMAVGLGSPTLQQITQPRVFSVMTGAVGINSTGPQYTLEVNGGAKAFNVSNFLFANGTNVGIGTNNPLYPLEVAVNYSGISIWSQGNISAAGYITRTDVYDKTKGNATILIKDASAYKKADGSINHSAFGYSYVAYTNRKVVGYHTVNVPREVCKEVEKLVDVETYDRETLEVNGTKKELQRQVECPIEQVPEVQPIYQNFQEEGVDLGKEVALLKQAIYELKLENEALRTRVGILEGKV